MAEGTYRFFRADRIHGIQHQEARFAPPPEFVLDGLIGERMPFTFSTQEKLVVRFNPKVARWVAEREGRQLDADGGVTADYLIGDEEWGIRFVLQYGPSTLAVAPEGVRLRIAALMHEATR